DKPIAVNFLARLVGQRPRCRQVLVMDLDGQAKAFGDVRDDELGSNFVRPGGDQPANVVDELPAVDHPVFLRQSLYARSKSLRARSRSSGPSAARADSCRK